MKARSLLAAALSTTLVAYEASAMTVYLDRRARDQAGLNGASYDKRHSGPVSAEGVIFVSYDNLPDAVAVVDAGKEGIFRELARKVEAGDCDGAEGRLNDFLRRAASTAYSLEDIDALWKRSLSDAADEAACWPELHYEPWAAKSGQSRPMKTLRPEYGAHFYADERGLLRTGESFTSGKRGEVEQNVLDAHKKPGALASIHTHPNPPGRYHSKASAAPKEYGSRVTGKAEACHGQAWEFAKTLSVGSGPSGDAAGGGADIGGSSAFSKPSVVVDEHNLYLFRSREFDDKLKGYTESVAAVPRSLFTAVRGGASAVKGKSCLPTMAKYGGQRSGPVSTSKR